MIERIHKVITQSSITSGIYNIVYTLVRNQFEGLKQTLSDQVYSNITEIVDKISTVSLILLTIYIIYLLFHFTYSLIFKRRFKLKILISLAIAFPFLILFYVVYSYLNFT